MQTLSASDAVSPALSRMKLVLFSPFRKGRTWKFAATSYCSRAGSAFYPFTLSYLAFYPAVERHWGSKAGALLVAGVLVFTALYVFLFYLCSRLQFAFFDVVLNREQFIAPAWRKYGPRARKFSLLKIGFGTVMSCMFAAPMIAYIRHLVPLMASLKPRQAAPPEFFTAVFAGYGIVLFGVGFIYLISALACDFVLPPLALEDVSLAEGFRRFGILIRNEPGQFALYVLLKVVFGIVGYIAVLIAFEISIFVLGIVVVLVAVLLGFLLHALGVPTAVLTVLGVIFLIGFYLFALVYVLMLAMGPLFTFLEAYTLYFLGGRYPLLGELLDRSTPAPPVYYAPPPSYPPLYPPPPPPEPSL